MLHNPENGLLTDEEINFIVEKCLNKSMDDEQIFRIVQEFNSMRLSGLLLEGVLRGDIDFVLKNGEMYYGSKAACEEDDILSTDILQ